MNNPIRIIVCGPDKCGKTTLVKGLHEHFKIPIYKSGREKELFAEKDAQFNVLKWAVYEQLKTIEILNASIIFDRFFPCEFAYSQTFKRNTDIDLIFKYDEWWHKLDGKIIVVCRNEQLENDDLIGMNYDIFDSLRNNYLKYIHKSKCNWLWLNDRTIDFNLKQNIGFIEGKNEI